MAQPLLSDALWQRIEALLPPDEAAAFSLSRSQAGIHSSAALNLSSSSNPYRSSTLRARGTMDPGLSPEQR